MGTKARAAAIAVALTIFSMLGAASAAAGVHHLNHFEYVAGSAGPLAIETAPDGSVAAVWLADNGGTPGIVRFAPDGLTSSTVIRPTSASLSGQLRRITGLAFDPAAGTLFVADQPNHRVLGFDAASGLPEIQAPGGAPSPGGCTNHGCPPGSTADGALNAPRGLDFTGAKLYAADGGNDRVQLFNPTLGFLSKFTRPEWSSSDFPRDIAVDSQSGHIFVALGESDAIDEFDSAGVFIRTISAPVLPGDDDEEHDVTAVAIDSQAKLLFVAREDEVLDIVNASTGTLVERVTEIPGTARDIAIDPVGHRLYVSIGGDMRTVKIYEYDVPPTCAESSQTLIAGETATFLLPCTDADGGEQTFTIVTAPAHGSVNLDPATGQVTYTPDPAYLGDDHFEFQVTTGNGTSGVYRANFTIVAAAAEPVVGKAAIEPPVIRESTNISWLSGSILVKLPGATDFVPMKGEVHVPIGTVVDASAGRCKVVLANQDTSQYSSTFWGGVFQVVQGGGDFPLATIKLRNDLVDDAEKASNASISTLLGIAKKKGKKKNKVWGNGKGKFRTTGSGGSASVRGTRWMVEDYANGTLFKVTSGKVLVRDFGKHKTLLLKPGKSYFAELKKKKKKKSRR